MKTRLIFAMDLHSFSLNKNVHDETERNAGKRFGFKMKMSILKLRLLLT